MKGLPRVAAVTMVRNEGAMLRRWVDHYGAQLGVESLVVIDDGSQDGSTDDLPCTVKRIKPIEGHFELARMRIVSEVAAKLLRKHAAVIFADADEFIVADPRSFGGLREFVAARQEAPAVGVLGLNVVHHLATEAPLDLGRPLLEQRRLVKFVPLLCKPSVKLVKNPWAAASHGVAGATFTVDPELYMFHMKFADRDQLQATAEQRRAMVDHDGRAAASSWQFSGDEMVGLLERINDGVGPALDDVPPFRPPHEKLADIVQTFDNGVTRATGSRQVVAMENRPLRTIPPRFRGLV